MDSASSLRTPTAGALDFLPTRRVEWGLGSIGRLGDLLDSYSVSRVLLMTTRSLSEQGSLLRTVEDNCGGRCAGRVEHLPAHVPSDAVERAAATARELGADALVSFGGGSVIDATKAVAARLADDDGRQLPHFAVPTTLSGAEFADHYGVTEFHDGAATKRTHTREDVTPVAVVLDGALTAATPGPLWAGSGAKALDHAVEGLICNPPRPVLDDLAQLGIRELAGVLRQSMDPGEPTIRQACQLAAWYCYFAPASLTLGLSHRIGHVLGGTYGVPHSLTSGITLPAVVRAMTQTSPQRLKLVARALDTGGPLDLPAMATDEPAEAAVRLSSLVTSVGLPTRMREIGIDRNELPAIALRVQQLYPEAIARLGTDSTESLRRLLEEAW
ncbi:iron-containing alcohol dehydrogenase [Streptomyces sp. NBC_00078]|uniref:iron-containing alcohol dehydrogenase n=1 Tax=unclassified Streptomyces TaxID=2593676 RepID=UPI0022500D4A|nr:iron-containing alcohol dehydrogenase [Streptomyces sp. NBC_00078]MCX5426058.1 iron-containing alcohol dehydrogenase [Streptomyces sp. NBC_00078]